MTCQSNNKGNNDSINKIHCCHIEAITIITLFNIIHRKIVATPSTEDSAEQAMNEDNIIFV